MFEDFLSLTQLFLVAAGYLIVCLFFLWLAVQGSLEVASFNERRRAHKSHDHTTDKFFNTIQEMRNDFS